LTSRSSANDAVRSRSIVARLSSVALVLLFAGVTTGCGIKLAYNNLDRFVRWSMDDYMTLDPAQEAYFRSELDAILYWHRTTQLPVYAQAIRQLDVDLADGASVEELFVFRKEVEAWWQRVLEESLPLSTQLMYSATGAQLDQFAVQYDKDIRKYIKPYEKLTPDARRARWARDFRDYFEYFAGRLSNDQRDLIVAQSRRFVPDESSWADYRRRYGAALIALVRQHRSYLEFSYAFRVMTFERERWYGEEYSAALASNQDLYQDLTIALLDSLTPEQHRQLSKSLQDLARDFDELALDAPPRIPAEACLITC